MRFKVLDEETHVITMVWASHNDSSYGEVTFSVTDGDETVTTKTMRLTAQIAVTRISFKARSAGTVITARMLNASAGSHVGLSGLLFE